MASSGVLPALSMPELMRPKKLPTPAMVFCTVPTGFMIRPPANFIGLKPASASALPKDSELLTFSSNASALSSLMRMRSISSPCTVMSP